MQALETLRSQSKLDLKNLLAAYVGAEIGANLRNPASVESARLASVQEDHFVLECDGMLFHVPYSQIIKAVSAPDRVAVKASVLGNRYPLVLDLFHLVVYKGAIGFGLSAPL